MFLFGDKKEEKKQKEVSVGKKKTIVSDAKKTAANALKDAASKKSNAPVKAADFKGADSDLAYRFLIGPWITEKGHNFMEDGKYIFKVKKNSDKKKVKKAVEDLYKVKVIKVNIINIPEKKRMYGMRAGKKSGYKKAVITLKKGDKIELFEGA